MKAQASLMIDRPQDEVWDFLTEWSNLPRINPTILQARQTSDGPLGVGTTVEATLQTRLLNRAMRIRVVEYEPDLKITLEHTSGPLRGTRSTFSLEGADGRTRLTCSTIARLSGPFKILLPFARGRVQRTIRFELSNVSRALTSKALMAMEA